MQFSNVVLDLDGLDDVEGRQARWLEDVMKKLNCTVETDCKAGKFTGQNKPVLARWLQDATDIISRQREFIENMKEMIELLKTEALGDKRNVIRVNYWRARTGSYSPYRLLWKYCTDNRSEGDTVL